MQLNKAQLLLCASAIGLVPIALSYGASPSLSLNYLFGIEVTKINSTHIYRALMGLYFSNLFFWLVGAFVPKLRQVALTLLAVFMLGLAAGRGLSFMLDGTPNWLLIVYFLLEMATGLSALYLLQKKSY